MNDEIFLVTTIPIGFGFLFDTFINQEHSGGHQDVTFYENDGSKTLDDLNYMNKVGCMAPGIRYHEKNAAFSPSLNMSRAKIQYKDHYVQVMMDAKNTGEWTQCYRSELSFADDWMEKAHIGITASTGSLADNHDVIALSVYE
jgi:mannose-binding lectin 2